MCLILSGSKQCPNSPKHAELCELMNLPFMNLSIADREKSPRYYINDAAINIPDIKNADDFRKCCPNMIIPVAPAAASSTINELKPTCSFILTCPGSDYTMDAARSIGNRSCFMGGSEMCANYVCARAAYELLSFYLGQELDLRMNEHDNASKAGCRPDGVISWSLSVLLRIEVKADVRAHSDCVAQLKNSLRDDAMVFQPRNAQYMFGMAVAGDACHLYRITRNYNSFQLVHLHWITLGRRNSLAEYMRMMAKIACYVSHWDVVLVSDYPTLGHNAGDVINRFDPESGRLHATLVYTSNSVIKHTCDSSNSELTAAIYSKNLLHLVRGTCVDKHEEMELCYSLENNLSFFADTDEHVKRIISDINLALIEMHEAGYAHCDVRLPNILVRAKLPTDPSIPWTWEYANPTFVLCDFDFARPISSPMTEHDRHKNWPGGTVEMNAVAWDGKMVNMCSDELTKRMLK